MARNPSLDELIELPFLKGDLVIKDLLKEIINRDDAILFVCNVSDRSFTFMDSTCEIKLGHSINDFLERGSDKMYEITVPSYLPAIIERQVFYVKQAKEPGFDPKSMIVMEFPGAVFTTDGTIREFYCLCIVLTFSKEADLGDAICIMADTSVRTKEECSSILEKIKNRHNEIFNHTVFSLSSDTLNVVHVTSQRFDAKISEREKQVLSLLANGSSTKEIANELSITEHTVETHRKHLLQKLEAQNTAELIKKASKVFWLE